MILGTLTVMGNYDTAVIAKTKGSARRALIQFVNNLDAGPLTYYDNATQMVDDTARFTEIEVGKVVYT